ncbi:hypothetical protein QT383_19665 [Stenotrophomonas rhizophila]
MARRYLSVVAPGHAGGHERQRALSAFNNAALNCFGSCTCEEWPSAANSTSVEPAIAAAAALPEYRVAQRRLQFGRGLVRPIAVRRF